MKLSVARDYEFPDLRSALDGLAVAPRADERVWSVYFDSHDRRLARWGVSLRFRDGRGWTVTLPDRDSVALIGRDEVVFAGARGTVPAGAVDLVSGYLRGADLRPQVRLHSVRRGISVSDGNGKRLAEVLDDTVSVLDGPRIAGAFRELEIATPESTPKRLLEALVGRLVAAGAGPPDTTPAYLRALGGPRVATPEVSVPQLAGSASLGEVIKHEIADAVTRLLRHDPVVRLDAHPEGVHRARVAARRLRSDLRTFRPALRPEWAVRLRSELGWLGAELGAARDADVLSERLTKRAEQLGEGSEATGPLLEALAQHRGDGHARALDALRSARYMHLIDCLVEAAQEPGLLEAKASRPAAKELPAVVEKAWRELRRRVETLSDPPTDEELHAVRILAKRCRYAAEAGSTALGKRGRRLAGAARDLQDVLGELNDAVVAHRWIRDWALHGTSGWDRFIAGELAGLEHAAAQNARTRWRKARRRVDG